MTNKAEVYYNGAIAGILEKREDGEYVFMYDSIYLSNTSLPAVSLSLPKTNKPYISRTLFPFFAGLVSEGANRLLQSQFLKIDNDDTFALLLATGHTDTIGPVTIKKTAINA